MTPCKNCGSPTLQILGECRWCETCGTVHLTSVHFVPKISIHDVTQRSIVPHAHIPRNTTVSLDGNGNTSR